MFQSCLFWIDYCFATQQVKSLNVVTIGVTNPRILARFYLALLAYLHAQATCNLTMRPMPFNAKPPIRLVHPSCTGTDRGRISPPEKLPTRSTGTQGQQSSVQQNLLAGYDRCLIIQLKARPLIGQATWLGNLIYFLWLVNGCKTR